MKRASPKYLRLPEKVVHKGHHYMTILSDEQTGIVIDIVEGRSDDSVDELCQTALTAEQRADVKTVCTENGIINALITGVNNARAERLNGSIQELKTYNNTQNFRIAILFFHANLDLIPHKKW